MEVRPEPIRASRRIPTHLLVAAILLVLAVVAVGASLAQPGSLSVAPLAAAAGASSAQLASPDVKAKPDQIASWGRAVWPGFMGANPGRGEFGGFGGRGGGFLPGIKITAINGTKISLESANGWARTIDTAGITITRAGAPIAVSGLKVGDGISISESRASDGTYTVKGLSVVLDQIGGTVSKIDAGSITVQRGGGKAATITTDGSTVYRRADGAIARSDISVGQQLTAVGTTGSDGSLKAEAVDVRPDVVMGTVTQKSGDSLTVSTFGGGTATVQVTPKTTFVVVGKAAPTLADVAVKDVIVAQGVKGANGVLSATSVRAGVMHGDSRGGWKGAGPAPAASASTSG